MEILAFRPARIQISYLGYPSTTGSNFHDYIIADKIVIPIEETQLYTEKVIHLPCYYHLVDDEHTISMRYNSKKSVGLPEDAFVFSSHCTKHKITPSIFETWISILKQVDQSVLWLAASSDYCKKNILNTLTLNDIDTNRVYFAEFLLDKADHLNRLQFADLVLDTNPYNGHTTTNDALHAGVPVLTLKGTHFASRVSESILSRMGLEELVTTNTSNYIQKAIELSHNPSKLSEFRTKISQNKSVFNMDNLVVKLEETYLNIIELEKSNRINENLL